MVSYKNCLSGLRCKIIISSQAGIIWTLNTSFGKASLHHFVNSGLFILKPEAAGAAAQAEGEADKSNTSDPFGKLSWFPATKEELLDYSAAYIQMMIMGAEMVKHQQQAPKPSSASAPNEYGEMAV